MRLDDRHLLQNVMTKNNKQPKEKAPKLVRSASQRGAWSRNKGIRAEQECARIYRAWLDDIGLGHLDVQRNKGQDHMGGSDLTGRGLGKWCVEVKFCKRIKLTSWKKQLINEAYHDRKTCLALWVRNAGQPFVVHVSEDSGENWTLENLDQYGQRFKESILARAGERTTSDSPSS